jgi:hypothetical protein
MVLSEAATVLQTEQRDDTNVDAKELFHLVMTILSTHAPALSALAEIELIRIARSAYSELPKTLSTKSSL